MKVVTDEIAEFDSVSDDDFVRIVDCLLVFAPESSMFSRVATRFGLPMEHIQAWSTRGKRICVQEVPLFERKSVLIRLAQAFRDEFAQVEEKLSA